MSAEKVTSTTGDTTMVQAHALEVDYQLIGPDGVSTLQIIDIVPYPYRIDVQVSGGKWTTYALTDLVEVVA